MKKKKALKIIAFLAIGIVIILLLSLFFGTEEEELSENEWAICLYLCGSDLESGGGFATDDLEELLAANFPSNVKVIIQTGGTYEWYNEVVDPNYIERYVCQDNELVLVDQQPLANMGSGETLSDFLGFVKENYPAEKTAFLFWNHGGGSVAGAAFDEIYDYDSLTLDEMYYAFSENYKLSEEDPPFELIGFDTCLMATLDVAYTFSDIGKYLVASEETEPANGWDYTGWANGLGEDPGMDGLAFGKLICDTYQDHCWNEEASEDITLSVTNLSKLPRVLSAYEDFGKEALTSAIKDPAFFSGFGRIATATENYGGNIRGEGCTNMVDLGHLARQSSEMLPGSWEEVVDALDDCVEYKINGPYREEATGLSCYYSYDGDVDILNSYMGIGAGEAFKYFYAYGLTGELSEDGLNYIDVAAKDLLALKTLSSLGWENHEVTVDKEGSAILTLGPKANETLTGIYLELYYVDLEQDAMFLLGTDNDIYADWDKGVFKDNFRGVWGGMEGNLVYMEIDYEGDNYNLYTVPILLNGEDYNLSVAYDYDKEAYEILGARKPIDENGMADKNLRKLVEGDIITIIHYFNELSSDNEELTPFESADIVVTKDLVFEELDMGDGMFMMMYKMVDIQGNEAYSDIIVFDVINGEITTTVGFAD